MLILLEGVDGAGKSSLADEIAVRVENYYPHDTVIKMHSGPLRVPPLHEYVDSIQHYTPYGGMHVVADRWHYGETIYAPLYRGGSTFTTATWRWTELWLASRGATVYVVSQPLDRLNARLTARGEDFLQTHHVARVRDEFLSLASTSRNCYGVLEPEGDTAKEVDTVMQRAAYNDVQVGVLPTDYVGSPLPSVLLVGGSDAKTATSSTYRPTDEGVGGDLLYTSLPEDWWRSIGVCSAVTHDASLQRLTQDVLFDPAVVALGAEASEILSSHGIAHGAVPAPDDVDHLLVGREEQYGWLIRDVAQTGDKKLTWRN